MTNNAGYYSYPIIFDKNIAFVSECDLWTVSTDNLVARRLTCNRGIIKTPVYSPCGQYIAFSCTTEGKSDLYLIPANGGEMKRITYMGDDVNVLCWNKEGIYFSSSYNQPFIKLNAIWKIAHPNLEPKMLNIGPANYISFSSDNKEAVIQRHGYKEYSYWKRYRGGTAGDLWISESGMTNFKKLLKLDSDLARPIWIKDQIIFSSDHDGIGNLYSTDKNGKDIKQLTHHQDYYVRNQYSDGKNIIYQSGGDIWLLELSTNKSQKLDIKYHSDRQGRCRKFFNIEKHLQGYELHPNGKFIAIISRGKLFVLGNWEGHVKQIDDQSTVRYKLPKWLNDGKRLLLISDDSGEEEIKIYDIEQSQFVNQSNNIDIGRITDIWVNPKNDSLIIFNHRNDILHITLPNWEVSIIDNSEYNKPIGGSWSPDGKWFTYSVSSVSRKQMAIKLFNTETKKVSQISNPVLVDETPVFDPEGKFIYFISHRTLEANLDNVMFEYGFGPSAKIYAIALQQNTPSPFLKPLSTMAINDEENTKSNNKNDETKEKQCDVNIDLDNIHNRVFEFPIDAGHYYNLTATKDKLFFISRLPETDSEENHQDNEASNVALEYFDFEHLKTDSIGMGVHDIQISHNHDTMLLRMNHKLRVLKTGEKLNSEQGFNPKSGWVDINRAKLIVNPVEEWKQMYGEAWRLQRDHYWVEDMSSIDWQMIFDRYRTLLERISNRNEFSDLMWEMQGELGTSHSYVIGGDTKKSVCWSQGSLGADFIWDENEKAYKISNIARGDIWDTDASSALINTGINVKNGDYLLSINQQKLTKEITPNQLLFNQQHSIIELKVCSKNAKNKKTFLTKPSTNLYKARYRDWVENNRKYIDKKTNGKVGYIHIPNMDSLGFAEFHRYFMQELDKDGLIIDVRFNGGGHISQLLLSKLVRKRLGYDKTRWHGTVPYFDESPTGPMVTLTNEYAGSDGDIFSHAFKMLELGPLIGKRTWGGVIGICPRYGLVDGGMTTQPEFSFWFKDVHWSVENYGVDPDIEIEIKPQDYMDNKDPQIDAGLQELDKIMQNDTLPKEPDMVTRPDLSLPFTK